MHQFLPFALLIVACVHAALLAQDPAPQPTHILTGHRTLWCVALSADGRTLASGDLDGAIKIWDAVTGKERATLSKHVSDRPTGGVPPEGVLAVAMSADGSFLASGHEGGAVQLWDVTAGKLAAALDGHRGQVWAVAFSPDGKLLAAGGGETTARVWEVATRKVRVELPGDRRPFASFAFAPDGTLASGNGKDDTVTLWDLATGKAKARLRTDGDNVTAVALSPDGRILAAGGGAYGKVVRRDRTLTLWDVVAGKERTALRGHDRGVRFAAFSGDGKLLATADEGVTARVWDVDSGKQRAVIRMGEEIAPRYGFILTAAFSRDGRRLAIAADNALLWDLPGPR